MKYTTEVEINKPVEKVVELFDNPDNLKHWMKGLVSFEHISGTPGQPGAKSRLKYKMGSREVEMIETILVRDLPKEFTGTYEANGVYNLVRNHFIPASAQKTRYVTEHEFKFNGFMMKMMGFLFPGMFKKQSLQFQKDFKAFAESR